MDFEELTSTLPQERLVTFSSIEENEEILSLMGIEQQLIQVSLANLSI